MGPGPESGRVWRLFLSLFVINRGLGRAGDGEAWKKEHGLFPKSKGNTSFHQP